MASSYLISIAVSLLLCCLAAAESPEGIETGNKSPYLTYTMKLYAHLSLGGPNPSELYVAPEKKSTGFGSVLVADDLLTAGISATSAAVGRVKGIGANTDSATGLLNSSLYLTFFIDHQGLKGTVIVLGTSIRSQTSRTFAILGGTDDFVLAQGQALQQTLSIVPKDDGSISMTNQWTLIFYCNIFSPQIAKFPCLGGHIE